MSAIQLPSLTALRAFDAAAQSGSFSAAARTLNVTHAAIAQQVRGLEKELGVDLAIRAGRGLALTREGQILATALREGFGGIAAALAQIRTDTQSGPLRITMTPSFASQWLMPRLGAFWAKHPDVPLTLHPDKRVIDLHREGMDLAIRFGDGHWPGVAAELLTSARHVVVASPRLVGSAAQLTPAQMVALPWVIEDEWPEQLAWMRKIGIDPDLVTGPHLPTEELALEAARQGYGLFVEHPALIEKDLASGRLVVVHQDDDGGLGYYLVTRPGRVNPALRLFTRWLKSVV
jgi:LysR family glycine cleavage system transcriptional activator